MMAWDGKHEVTFLVTGDCRGIVNAWALRARK